MSRRSVVASTGLTATARDRAIVRAVARHGAMTRRQIGRLCFTKPNGEPASAQVACRRLRLLAQRGFLKRQRLLVAQGSGQYVYLPGKGAKGVLSEEEQALCPGTGGRARSALGLYHGLEVVDFYLVLREALQRQGGTIETWLTEREARYSFECSGRSLPLTPDGYCLWALRGEEGSFFLEWDRGTESMFRLEQKLERYDEYYRLQAHREHLGEIGLRPRLAMVVPDERREKRVAQWIARALGKGQLATLPTVMIGTSGRISGGMLGPVWLIPGKKERARLTD
jgi:hypothetical protein